MIKLITLCLIVNIFATYNMASVLKNVSASSKVEELWPIYKAEHNKVYNEEEDRERFETFKANVQKIVEHNEKFERKEVTFSMGINQFTDKKPEEYRFGCLRPQSQPEAGSN